MNLRMPIVAFPVIRATRGEQYTVFIGVRHDKKTHLLATKEHLNKGSQGSEFKNACDNGMNLVIKLAREKNIVNLVDGSNYTFHLHSGGRTTNIEAYSDMSDTLACATVLVSDIPLRLSTVDSAPALLLTGKMIEYSGPQGDTPNNIHTECYGDWKVQPVFAGMRDNALLKLRAAVDLAQRQGCIFGLHYEDFKTLREIMADYKGEEFNTVEQLKIRHALESAEEVTVKGYFSNLIKLKSVRGVKKDVLDIVSIGDDEFPAILDGLELLNSQFRVPEKKDTINLTVVHQIVTALLFCILFFGGLYLLGVFPKDTVSADPLWKTIIKVPLAIIGAGFILLPAMGYFNFVYRTILRRKYYKDGKTDVQRRSKRRDYEVWLDLHSPLLSETHKEEFATLMDEADFSSVKAEARGKLESFIAKRKKEDVDDNLIYYMTPFSPFIGFFILRWIGWFSGWFGWFVSEGTSLIHLLAGLVS